MPALDRFTLAGFKSIKKFDLELRPINVLIGQNGAGKSNFISFFRMLNALMEQRLQEYVAKSGGANTLLHYGQKTTETILALMFFGKNDYIIQLTPSEEDALVINEMFGVEGESYGTKPSLGVGHKEALAPRVLKEDSPLHDKLDVIVSSIRSWKVYHFHDTSSSAPIKKTGDIHDNEFLRPNAENLAAFLYLLQEKHPEHYALIRATVQRAFSRFGDFLLRPNRLNEDTIRLEWKEKGSDYRFGPHQISDGTLRFMGLATLLLQPNLPSTPNISLITNTLLHYGQKTTETILALMFFGKNDYIIQLTPSEEDALVINEMFGVEGESYGTKPSLGVGHKEALAPRVLKEDSPLHDKLDVIVSVGSGPSTRPSTANRSLL